MLAITLASPWLPPIQRLDGLWLDRMFALERDLKHTPTPEVVVVGIDEESVAAFPEPMALWHRHLASACLGLASARPLGVGLDVVLPDRSMDACAPGFDAELVQGLLALRRTCPTVLALTLDAGHRVRPLHPSFLAAAGDEGTGLALWPVDRDGVVRRHALLSSERLAPIPTLASRLAQRLGGHVRAGYLDYTLGGPSGYIPFHQVVAWARQQDLAALRTAFQGRIVVLGSVLPFEDRHPVPIPLAAWEKGSRQTPGVLLQVQALRTFLGRGPIQAVPRWSVLTLACLLFLGGWGSAARPLRGGTALGLQILISAGASLVLLSHGWLLPVGPLWAGALAGWGGRTLVQGLAGLRERDRLRRFFAGSASPALLQAMLDGRLRPDLQGERLRVCVLFADLRAFTPRCEQANPAVIFSLMNRYFEAMARAIHHHDGTLIQFEGDGLLAVFGAPDPMATPTVPAFRAAQDMWAALAELNAQLILEGMAPLRMGMGLHVGPVAAGRLGSHARNQYAVVGDTVNTAARLEGLSEANGHPLILSEAAVAELKAPDLFEPLGTHPLKGRSAMALYGWPRAVALPYPEGTP